MKPNFPQNLLHPVNKIFIGQMLNYCKIVEWRLEKENWKLLQELELNFSHKLLLSLVLAAVLLKLKKKLRVQF